jgi:hypothetical protein
MGISAPQLQINVLRKKKLYVVEDLALIIFIP